VRPPECDLCGASGEDVVTVHFAGEHDGAGSTREVGAGHPDGLAWLCAGHVDATRSLTHLTFAAARRVVGLTESPPGVPSLLSLQWPSGTCGTDGVEVSSSEVLWWSRPGGSGGRFGEAARGQSHEDYRLHGPAVACPPEVERQVDVAVGR
tara:strand:- start:183 stop:635 length:453 start_codon:yes stop_codon:yes gene_type:complete